MEAILGIVAVVLLLACLVFAGGGCSGNTAPPPQLVTTIGMKSLDRTAVRAMLKRLAGSPPPTKMALGAMCYDMAPPPDRAEYVCPKCGERTLYEIGESTNTELRPELTTEVVQFDLCMCRREFAELRKVVGDAIEFDESQFCRKCSPRVTSPTLVLRITYEDGSVRRVDNVQHDDLRMLREFLEGRLLGKADNGGEQPLKDNLGRLEELLGVKSNEEPAKAAPLRKSG